MNAITAISKCAQLIVRGSEVINELDVLWEKKEFDGLKTVSLASKTTLLFLGIAEMAFGLTGKHFSSAARLAKAGELAVRTGIETPLQAIEAFHIMMDDRVDTLTKVRAFEKKIIGSFAGLIRATVEADLKQQQYYLSLSKEQQATIQIPIYDYNLLTESPQIIGYKPFDREECERTVVGIEKSIPILNAVETSLELNVGSKIIGISQKAFEMLTKRTLAKTCSTGQANPKVAENVPDVKHETPVNMNRPAAVLTEENDISNLLLRDSIPVELEEDPVLKQFTCAITHRPIRHIVADPTASNHARIFYERSAIESWLKNNPTSPFTRSLLLPSQLVPCIGIQTFIDHRLSLYAQKIREELVRLSNEPFNQQEVDQAIAEVQV